MGNIISEATEQERAWVNGIAAKKVVQIDGSTGNVVSPVSQTTQSEEAILLRRIVKLLESNAVVDINGRQRINIESIAGTTLGASVTGLSSGAGVACVNDPTANAPRPSPGTTYWQPVWIGPVDQRFQIIDAARLTYDQAIRSHLSFT